MYVKLTSVIPRSNVIKTIRIKKGLSLRGLAIKSKIHYATLSNIENAKGGVNPQTAKSICKALGCSFDDLFEIVEKEG